MEHKELGKPVEIMIETLKSFYEKVTKPCCVGKSKNENLETLLIRNKANFSSHILSNSSVSGDKDKKKMLEAIIKKTQYSLGVTSFIEAMGKDLFPSPDSIYQGGYSLIAKFEIPEIVDLDSYVNPRYVKKQPAARGKVFHHMIQSLIIRDYSCYSTTPVLSIPEASSKTVDIPSSIESFVVNLQNAGFSFLASEYPVLLTKGPVLKNSDSKWRWLVGKCDLLAYHKDYGVCLIDFKLTDAVAVRRRHALQLSLLAVCLASMGQLVDSIILINVRPQSKTYPCFAWIVNFDQANTYLTLATNNKIASQFGEEDFKRYKALISELISTLGCIMIKVASIKKSNSSDLENPKK